MPRGQFKSADAEEWAARERMVKRVIDGEITAAAAADELGASAQSIRNWKSRYLEAGELVPRSRGRPRAKPARPEDLVKIREAVKAWRSERGIAPGAKIPKSGRPTMSVMAAIASEALGRKVSVSYAVKAAGRIGVNVVPDPIPAPLPEEAGEPGADAGGGIARADDGEADDDGEIEIDLPVTAEEYESWVAETRAMMRERDGGYGRPGSVGHGQKTGKHAKAQSQPKKRRKKRRKGR